MSVRSKRLRAKTPTSYVKYNLDFNEGTDDDDEEELADTFQSETNKPAFSLKIKRKLRQTLDLVDLSPNKDEEPEDPSKGILKTPLSIKKTRKKASQFMPKVDKIEYDPIIEPARKLVKAKRRLERQDHIEEECDKYFNFKIEEETEETCATQVNEMASSDDHVLTEVRKTRRSTRNVGCEVQADNVQSASRKSSCTSEQLNKTSKTPQSALKNERFTPKSGRKSQKSVELASSPNGLAVSVQEKTAQSVAEESITEHFVENFEGETEALQAVSTVAKIVENEGYPTVIQFGSKSQNCDTPKMDIPSKQSSTASKSTKNAIKNGRSTSNDGRRSQKPMKRASSRNDLVVSGASQSVTTETGHTVKNFENETEADSTVARIVEKEGQSKVIQFGSKSQKCDTPELDNLSEQPSAAPKSIKSAVKNGRSTPKDGRKSQRPVKQSPSSTSNDLVVAKQEDSPKSPQNVEKIEHVSENNVEHEAGNSQVDTTVTKSVEKKRQSRVSQLGNMSQKSDTAKLENCRFSTPKGSVNAEENIKKSKISLRKSNRFSTATENMQVESTTPNKVEAKMESRVSKIGRMSQNCDKTLKPRFRRASVDENFIPKQDTIRNTPQSGNNNSRQSSSVEYKTSKITPKSTEKKKQWSNTEKNKMSKKSEDIFNVSDFEDETSTKQTPKSGNKSNHRTNISGNERNGTVHSFDMFDDTMEVDSTYNVEETLAVSRENSVKTYGRKSKDSKQNSIRNSTNKTNSFDKDTSMTSTLQAVTDLNVERKDPSYTSNSETKLNVDSGEKKISFNKSSMSGKSHQDSVQLDQASSRKSSTSFSKTRRTTLSEAYLKRMTPSSVEKPKRDSIISRKRWSLRSNSFCMHLADNDSINLVSPTDLKRKMSSNTPESSRSKRQGSLHQKVLRKNSLQNTPLKEKVANKSVALIRNSGSSTPITEQNQFDRHTSIFEELSTSGEPTDLLDTTTPPNEISYEPEEITVTEDSTIKPKKRRTFELDSSVNDISTLKLVSRRDSKRMSGIRRSPTFTRSAANRTVQKFNGSTIILDDSSIDSSNSVIFVDEYFENKKSTSMNDIYGRDKDASFDIPVERQQKRKSRSLDNVCEKTKKSSMFFMPGQHVSTPMPNVKTRRKNSLLKQVLSASAATVAQSISAKKTVSKVRNMPNFALIHQKAFDKMEDIAEHKQRKDERAKNLLSGKKPNNDEATPQRSSSTKKKLRFAEDTAEKEKPADFIPLPNTPRPQKRPKRSSSITPSSRESTPQCQKSKIAIPKLVKNPAAVFQGNKENDAGFKNAWKPAGFTKFGFAMKAPNKPLKEREEVKAVIEKTRVVPINDTNKRRNVIKGVRSNRRFDLLMKMRNKRE